MIRLNSQTQKVDTVFVMMLFVLFAITSFILIILGIKQYQVTADKMSDNYEIRTATSYLVEKVRQNDCGDGIEIVDLDGVTALSMSSKIDDTTYYTYIYFYDGYLRELFVSADSVYTPQAGQAIIEVAGLELSQSKTGHIQARIYASDGTDRKFVLATKSNTTIQ